MPDPPPRLPPTDRTRRGPVLAGLVLAMFMAAIEGTIVAAAMPSITASLGGFALYAWVFAAYLLMQAVATPVFGKLADLMGRKPVFVLGISVFLVGSVACGLAPTMAWLVAFRLIQGLGAGAVQPVVSTLAGDLYAFHERARVQGWLSSVWGLSAVAGPLAGGLIVERLHWAWIFWLNVPFGLLAIVLILRFLHERIEPAPRRIDRLGVALFAVAVAAAIVVLTQAATLPGWGVAAGATVAVAAGAVFWRHERRAPDAMIPPELWRDPLVRTANLATLGSGAVMIAVIGYLPTFAQGVLGTSALVAGFTLTTMSMGWPVASVAAGHLMVRIGSRATARIGAAALLAGALALALLDAGRSAGFAASGSAAIGVGMGLLSTTFLVSVQTRVGWRRRGAATATTLLMRILGNALGAALLGGIVNASLLAWLRDEGLEGTVRLDDVTRLMDGATAADPALLARVQVGLEGALGTAFVATAVVATVTLALAFAMPDLAPDEVAASDA